MNITLLVAFIISLFVSAIGTKLLIPYLRHKQFGQFIREEGPQAHKKKAGTPTMGGVMIVFGIIVGLVTGMICNRNVTADTTAIILTMLAFGIIGFLDDFEKIAKKNNLGLTPKQKIMLQILFSLGIGLYMIFGGSGTEVFIPFVKIYVNFGVLFMPFVIITEVAMSNGVNLSDGLDGLASSVTLVVAILFALVGYVHGNDILMISGVAIAGSLIGFLVFNKYPARIFMGDTGSMALGGVLSAIAIVSKTEFLLPIAGIIYVVESLSVIIQVTYFRKTGGKRFFRMAPIHHHFELGGMKEYNVVKMFTLVTICASAIAYFAA
ncbi:MULTISPECIES: phospho-N-acetylmuramoyl-pentapeptide-transferase [Mogibacterium]|jgi:phospho-N-acetylmuramoyl-pentapeptide-transferase|uniref:Phospho-N-acetylmuramoyl-pentapeptide-transferase n=1 Tax=Mogibacterium timidum ATCC 33093 TaxID=1401079 RepID=X8IR43_9FIRM|nr:MULTISPECIES: phospho-N-acetylmuramoyl-pentapeptide-transferase [Mogibacterium]EJU24009.1 phospho-N-acetylmuramoyl-pentapeptide-transferase [Mogibacterium sp. CM50]EUC52563.1 phospho-N-acetylmuramoyl-pentapeptide-transferase [Mogibacterium timidum ATCC 33093]